MSRMPALFLGHGNPLNALERNRATEAWRALSAAIPVPRAILSISAHWYLPACAVTAQERPPTLHDFGGFPDALYQVRYPAPGSPELAARVAELLAPAAVAPDHSWGLDHGTWSLLVHLYPGADVPVVQLSIDERLEPAEHLALAARLFPLRDEGVLVLGTGNLVHNLRLYDWGDRAAPARDWAVRYEARVRALIDRGDAAGVAASIRTDPDGRLAAPTLEHFLPLLYVLALSQGDPIGYPVEGFEGGSISMLGVRVG